MYVRDPLRCSSWSLTPFIFSQSVSVFVFLYRIACKFNNSIDKLLSDRECEAWITFAEEKGFERTFHLQTFDMAHRDNGRTTLHSPDVAAAVFARVGPFVPREMEGRCVYIHTYIVQHDIPL